MLHDRERRDILTGFQSKNLTKRDHLQDLDVYKGMH